MARRLHLVGMRPISVAVDVTNYVMLELVRALSTATTADKLAGPIRVRRARSGERITTLNGVDRRLSVEDLLMGDLLRARSAWPASWGARPPSSPPASSRVVIEAAHFDPVSIFRTQRRHKLPSEASKRFERGVDPTLPEAAAHRVAELLVAHAGGTLEPGVTKVGTALASVVIELGTDLPARITGMDIEADIAVRHLVAVGCDVERDGDRLRVAGAAVASGSD